MNKFLVDLAKQIDAASDMSDIEALQRLDQECAARLMTCESSEAPTLWYYRSNVQAALQELDDPHSWKWRQPHRERQILYLRQSRSHAKFNDLSKVVRAQVTTNLANNLDSLGRSVEALALYDVALRLHPKFAMALGNRGMARMRFAQALHDRGHATVIFVAALDDLLEAASPEAIWDSTYVGVREQFIEKAKEIEGNVDVSTARSRLHLEAHSLGRSKQEKTYRQWALTKRLFLNPLNAIGAFDIAATDRFNLPAYRSKIGEPPQFIAWFNQLKQEYVTARLLLFECENGSPGHFADRETLLVDTLDYSVFGVLLEKMRFAFRSAYSLLDKTAGFVNAYFELGENPERVNLRNVWLTKNGQSIRPEFLDRQNLSLRGLYWLALDIVGTEPDDPDAIRPDAAELYRLRNALEHRCVALREFDNKRPAGVVEITSVGEFRRCTFTMMRLAQAAIIYLSLAVRREEQMRYQDENGFVPDISLPTYKAR